MAKERPADKDFGESYLYHARTLRNWFVAYGIGAPALLLASNSLADRLLASPHTSEIAALFVAGVALQVATALLYKTLMWYRHCGELLPSFKEKRRHKVAVVVSDWMWLEIAFDLATIAAFGRATWLLFSQLIPSVVPPTA